MTVRFRRFNTNDNILPFDCGDADLNGFLLENSKDYDLNKFVQTKA